MAGGAAAGSAAAPLGERASGSAPAPHAAANLVQNGDFESDWSIHAFGANRRFLLLSASDMGMGEADGKIDHWQARNARTFDLWEWKVARSGSRSLKMSGNRSASHRIRFAGEQNPQTGGAYYAEFLAMEKSLAPQLARRPITVGAWCCTDGVAPGGEPELKVTVECAVRNDFKRTAKAPQGSYEQSVRFSGGSHEWEYREVKIDPALYEGTPFWVTVRLSGGERGGTAWFDDVSCVETLSPEQPNRLANAGFEAADGAGWPEGWSKPAPWSWWRSNYYLFTGWSHGKATEIRGGAEPDAMITAQGGRSLRMTVFPGDSFAVAGAPIVLNQEAAHPVEARALVKTDSLRGLEIMAQDEGGKWLPQSDFLGDDTEDNPGTYDMGTVGAGTHGWMCVRKFFSPRSPVKSLRLFLCARGFDGKIVEKNKVGVVWWDDVRVLEHGASKPAAAPPQPGAAPAPFKFRVADATPGDRLWGQNRAQLTLALPDAAAAEQVRATKLEIQVAAPGEAPRSVPGEVRITRAPSAGVPGEAVASAAYRIEKLCQAWDQQYQLTFQLMAPGNASASLPMPFGTPSSILPGGVTHYYAYPGETVEVWGNVNVARESWPELERYVVGGTMAGASKQILNFTTFDDMARPKPGPDYLDTNNILRALVKSDGLKVNAWSEPLRDNAVTCKLVLKGGKVLAETPPIRFGFMQRPPKQEFPQAIRKTGLDERGYLQINGQPYFPVYWTAHFGTSPEANYPPRLFGLKSADLTSAVYASGKAPGPVEKAEILRRVNILKADPKLFQYELGEGEMQLQDAGWRQRAEWLKTAIGWIREADPDHLISGPESWLVGHPGHNEAMAAFIPQFDAIGVEASFEEVPRLRQFAEPLMKGRRTGVLIGLETYFYQPLETLRWRGYQSVIEGAAGVGLCPSGMLQSKPDRENYLRGLNAEFRTLGPIITAAEPKERTRASTPLVQLMERSHGGKRYLIAVRGRDTMAGVKARFTLPAGVRPGAVRAMFEDRKVAVSGDGFEDDFAAPMAVHVYELQ